MLLPHLALIVAALFTGAAIYVSAVEQPARLGLDDAALLTEWKPAYKRGTLMQAPLAVIGGVLGLIAWWQTRDMLWLAGGIAMLANMPYTLLIIMPVNKRLTAMTPGDAAARPLIQTWARLHAGRSALGVVATVLYLAALA
jgi:hypothetical protein